MAEANDHAPINQTRLFGPLSIFEILSSCLQEKKDPVLSNSVFHKLNIFPFRYLSSEWDNKLCPTVAYVTAFARYNLLQVKPTYDRSRVQPAMTKEQQLLVSVMGEMLAVILPTSHLETGGARKQLIVVAQWFVTDPTRIGGISGLTAELWTDAITHMNYPDLGTKPVTLPSKADLDLPDNADDEQIEITAKRAMWVLIAISHYANEWGHNLSLKVLVHTLVAITKQGHSPRTFIKKACEALQTDLKIVLDISPVVLDSFYKFYGALIDETNAEQCIKHCLGLLPSSALRLRLTILPACPGLTVFITVGRAVRIFKSFDWACIARVYPNEVRNFTSACATVKGNAYYGFKKNLGVVSSTNYKNLGWVCYRLLVGGRGETSLNGYQGWPRAVPFQKALLAKITTFLHTYTAGDVQSYTVAEGNLVPVTEFLDAINNEQYNFLFAE